MQRAVGIGVLASVLWAGGLIWTASSVGRLVDGLGRTHCHFTFEEDPARDCRKWGHRVFTAVDVDAAFPAGAGAAGSTFGRHVFRTLAREQLDVRCLAVGGAFESQ